MKEIRERNKKIGKIDSVVMDILLRTILFYFGIVILFMLMSALIDVFCNKNMFLEFTIAAIAVGFTGSLFYGMIYAVKKYPERFKIPQNTRKFKVKCLFKKSKNDNTIENDAAVQNFQRSFNSFIAAVDYDDLFSLAVDIVLETGQASASMLQRNLHLSFSRASELIDQMEECKIVGPFENCSPRKILIDKAIWDTVSVPPPIHVDVDAIIKEEKEWQAEQRGADYVSPEDYVEQELYKIDNMDGHSFEYWCAEILEGCGFSNVSVTQGSGDQGVDVLAERDGIKYAIQCKCYSSDLGNKPIQEVNTGKVIYHCHIGVVMTNRYFTSGAKQAADATGTLLWDRDELVKLINLQRLLQS